MASISKIARHISFRLQEATLNKFCAMKFASSGISTRLLSRTLKYFICSVYSNLCGKVHSRS